jgi:hypothetical protein
VEPFELGFHRLGVVTLLAPKNGGWCNAISLPNIDSSVVETKEIIQNEKQLKNNRKKAQ